MKCQFIINIFFLKHLFLKIIAKKKNHQVISHILLQLSNLFPTTPKLKTSERNFFFFGVSCSTVIDYKASEVDLMAHLHSITPKTPAPQNQPIERKQRRGKS